MFAGTDDENQRLNDTWMYDLKLKEWTEVKNSAYLKPRNGHSAIIYDQRFMIVFGGIQEVTKELDDVNVLDVHTGKWHEF